MVRVEVRIISWYIWCNFEKLIDCRTQSFISVQLIVAAALAVDFRAHNLWLNTYSAHFSGTS